MSKLQAFLKPIATQMTKEICVSDRYIDPETKKPATLTIRAITQEENNALIKKATLRVKDKGEWYERLDKHRYQALLVNACVVEPDFSAKEICDAFGVVDPLMVPTRMFLSGEFATLISEIMDLNGFKDSEELADEAKN